MRARGTGRYGALARPRRTGPSYRPDQHYRFDAVFTNKELHARVKAEAKRKFKVYPSAYANAWMVKEYKKRGGGFRNDDLKKWFNEKWLRMSAKGEILGECGDRGKGEGKPRCLPLAKARALSKKERASTVKAKRRKDPKKNRSGAAKMVPNTFDSEGKKYSKTVVNPETGRKRTVKYGAKGYRIAPGTDKGDRYCARSFGDMKSHGKDCSGKDRNTPLCLSRAKWKCSGKSSRKDAGQGKPCGNSHIPKAHKCSKGSSSSGRSIAAQKRREKVPKDKEYKELRKIENEMNNESKYGGNESKSANSSKGKLLTAAVAASAVGAVSIGGVLAYKNRKSIVPEISQKSIRALSSDQVKRGLNKIPGKLGEDARSLVGDAKLAAAKMGLSAQGAVCKSVNIKDNFSTWVNKDGTHLSVGSIGDSLLTFGAQRKGEVGGFPQFGLGFTIDTTYDAKGGMPPSQASKVIRTTRSMFKDQMAQLPENAVLFAVPHQDDGKGGKRKSIYESMGFTSLNKNGVKGDRLWALKNQGKFTRIPSEQQDHIAKLILG